MKKSLFTISSLGYFLLSLSALFHPLSARSMPKPKPTSNSHNISAVLAFGDSFFNTGNNNWLETRIKSLHAPYGQDWREAPAATGRFSNGMLIPDFIGQFLGIDDIVPPFLEVKDAEPVDAHGKPLKCMLTGVSFALAGSGMDERTSTLWNTVNSSTQAEYLAEYVQYLRQSNLGEKKAERVVNDELLS